MSTKIPSLTEKNFENISIDQLKPYKNNARKHPPEQIEKLTASILAYGFIVPAVIDSKNRILVGHGRIQAAKKAGLDSIPVVRVKHLTEHQKNAFTLADNKLTEMAEWDTQILKCELQNLVEAELNCEIDFETTITGFETAEIDNLLDSDTEERAFEEGIAEEHLEKTPVSAPGDIWQLGRHRIICADSLDKAAYTQLVQKETCDLLCSDAPYNLPIGGFVSGKNDKYREFANASGEMSEAEFISFLQTFILNSLSVLNEAALVYLFMDWRHDQELQTAAKKCGLKQLNLCIWDKGSGGMGSLYRSQHELVFVYKHGNKPHTNNILLGRYGRNRTNVWYHPSANMTRQGRKALQNHPTPKPVPLVMDVIKDSTQIGERVLDPFLGSGTTLLAAEKTRRCCMGIEIDPLYVDLSIRRWQELTNKDAIHVSTGITFTSKEQSLKAPKRIRERKHGS